MKLPKTNRNEELEEMSNRAFVSLFAVTKFLIRPETKDKGIDYRIEIKISGAYSGFQFLVQLKSSESIIKMKTEISQTSNLLLTQIHVLTGNLFDIL